MDYKLLFPSSTIFENPTINNCLRQDIIDIAFDCPPFEEVEETVFKCIEYIFNTRDKIKNGTMLLINTFLRDAMEKYPKIFMNTEIIQAIMRMASFDSIQDFVSNLTKMLLNNMGEISNELRMIFEDFLEANGMETNEDEKVKCLIDGVGLILTKMKQKNIALKLIPILIKEDVLNVLIAKAGIFSNYPDVCLAVMKTDIFYEKYIELGISAYQERNLLKILTNDIFKQNFIKIYEIFIKEAQKHDIHGFLIKSVESKCDLSNINISMLLDECNIDTDPLPQKVWEYFWQYEFKLSEKTSLKYRDYKSNISFFIKVNPNFVKFIPISELISIINEENADKIYNNIFKQMINYKDAQNISFWINFLKYKINSMELAVKYLNANFPQRKMIEFVTSLLERCPFSINASKFANEIISQDKLNINAGTLIKFALNCKYGNSYFWNLFNDDSLIVKYLNKPSVLHGYTYLKYFGKSKSSPSIELKILDQNQNSYNEIKRYLQQPFKDIKELYDYNDYSDASLSLIASANLIAISSLKGFPTPRININDSVLFILLLYKFFYVANVNDDTIAKMFNDIFYQNYSDLFEKVYTESPVNGFTEFLIEEFLTLVSHNLKIFFEYQILLESLAHLLLSIRNKISSNNKSLTVSVIKIIGYALDKTKIKKNIFMNCIDLLRNVFMSFISLFIDGSIYLYTLPDLNDIKFNIEEIFPSLTQNALFISYTNNITCKFIVFWNNFLILPDSYTFGSINKEKIIQILEESFSNKDEKLIEEIAKFIFQNKLYDIFEKFINPNYNTIFNEYALKALSINKLKFIYENINPKDVAKILLMSNKIKDDVFYSLISNLILDENTIVNHYRMLIEKVYHRFAISLSSLVSPLSEQYHYHPDQLCQAINEMYECNYDMLIQRAVQYPIRNFSPYLISIIKYVISIAKTHKSENAFFILKIIANYVPFIFVEFNISELLEIAFESIEYLNDYIFEESKELTSHFIEGISAVSFIHFICYSPMCLDIVIPYILTKIKKMSKIQLYLSLLILNSLKSISTVQQVLISLLMKYDFIGFFNEYLKKNNQKDHKIELAFYNILNFLITELNNINENTVPIYDELQLIDNPFQQVFNGLLITVCDNRRNFPLDFIINNMDEKLKELIGFISKDYFERLNVNSFTFNSNELHERLIHNMPTKKNLSLNLPSNVSSKGFANLTKELQSNVLIYLLPKIPKTITPAMRRFLLTKPFWVSQYLYQNNSFLLPPDYYLILYPIILGLEKLENIQEIEKETLVCKQFCQYDLYKLLLENILSIKDENNNFCRKYLNLIYKFSENIVGLTSIIEILYDMISKYPYNVTEILLEICKNNDNFRNYFGDYYSQHFFKAISTFSIEKSNTTELFRILDLFYNNDINDYDKIQYLMNIFVMIPYNELNRFIPFLLKVNPSKAESIYIYIDRQFTNIINELKNNDFKNVNLLFKLLDNFKDLKNQHHLDLLSLLEELLKNYNSKHLLTLGKMFDLLCPTKDNSLSIKSDLSQSVDISSNQSTTLRIPKALFLQSPEFWKIVDFYKSLLSNLIKKNPKLIFKEFHFLQEFPEILYFQTKMNIFHSFQSKKISQKSIDITVSRKNILDESFTSLNPKKPSALLSNFHIKFKGEEGVDNGGIRRNWFSLLISTIFNPIYGLFVPSSNGINYQPSLSSYINPNHIAYFKFAGKMLARTIIEGLCVDAHLTKAFLKTILKLKMNLSDVEDSDEALYKSLTWIRDNEIIEDEIDMTFTTDFDDIGVYKTVELKPGGSDIRLNEQNKHEFIELMVQYRLITQVQEQMQAFCDGFYSLIPYNEISFFRPDELDLLICGVPEIDIEDLRRNTRYEHPYNNNHPIIKMFFNVLKRVDSEFKAKFLLFLTGSSKIPVGGFSLLLHQGRPITISPGGDPDRLPCAHTCSNTLDLPYYRNENELEEKLSYAIQECNSFGFA